MWSISRTIAPLEYFTRISAARAGVVIVDVVGFWQQTVKLNSRRQIKNMALRIIFIHSTHFSSPLDTFFVQRIKVFNANRINEARTRYSVRDSCWRNYRDIDVLVLPVIQWQLGGLLLSLVRGVSTLALPLTLCVVTLIQNIIQEVVVMVVGATWYSTESLLPSALLAKWQSSIK